MDKIFMTCVEKAKDSGKVKLAVFLKGKKEHLKDLMGFLQNQKVDCSEIPQQQQREMQEFAYFDEGFHMIVEPDRWSFYELKSYIQTYANTWDDDVVLRDTLLQELRTCDEGLIFDEHFYLELSKQIDKCEDRYYQENMSTSLFISGILKVLRHNLQLYWAAAKLIEIKKPRLRTIQCMLINTIC